MDRYPSPEAQKALAARLNLKRSQVEVRPSSPALVTPSFCFSLFLFGLVVDCYDFLRWGLTG